MRQCSKIAEAVVETKRSTVATPEIPWLKFHVLILEEELSDLKEAECVENKFEEEIWEIEEPTVEATGANKVTDSLKKKKKQIQNKELGCSHSLI